MCLHMETSSKPACKICNKPVTGFRRRYCGNVCAREGSIRRSKDFYRANKEKYHELAKQWREENREKWLEINRLAAKRRRADGGHVLEDIRRRARKIENGLHLVTKRDLNRILNRYRGCCAYCGHSLRWATLHWDHVLPLAKGGRHCKANLLPTCSDCNQSKGADFYTFWRRRKPRIAVLPRTFSTVTEQREWIQSILFG